MDPAKREESLRDREKTLEEERRSLRTQLYDKVDPNDTKWALLRRDIESLDAQIAEIQRKIDIIESQAADSSVVSFFAEY